MPCWNLVWFLHWQHCMTKHDEFGFGEKRAKKFRDLYMTGVDYINKGYAYMDEYKQGIKEQLGIEVKLI